MKWPGLRNLEGYLPEALEKGYRQYYLKTDTRVASISMVFLTIILAVFAYSDYILFGFSLIFYILLGLRILYCVYFIVLMLYLRSNTIPPRFDNNLFAWLLAGIALVTMINATRPPDYIGNIAVDAVLILLVYMGMPMKLLYRILGALIFTAGEFIMLLFFRYQEGSTAVFSSMVALLMANAVGILGSSLLYSFRRREYRQRIEKEEIANEWQETFNSITDLISIQDTDCRLIRVNKAYASAFHKTPAELEGRHCFNIVHGTDAPIENCPHIQTLKTDASQTEEVFEPTLGRFLEVTTSPIRDTGGKIIYTVHLAKDITERKKMESDLKDMATHDGLTGLPNRTLLYDRFNIAAAGATREKRKMVMMVMDLDKFKTVNDTYGHIAGDQLLKEVAARLTAMLRKSDTIARVGGDEFVVFLPEIAENIDATKAASKVLRGFVDPFKINDVSFNVTSSIGIAIYPDNGTGMEELLRKADAAMYAAKESGRNNYRFFEEKMPL